ncbi:CsbD family protein [Roseomonas sp. BN140053]|uniref:CsbD family protein n=1 Tax=Roseomonas sp. BN140053 TaxID=3391898 RepID=UPI0039E82B7F
MDENRVTGAARDFGGKVQDAVGGLTGDTDLQASGKANQIQGQAENALGQLADSIREQPLTSILIGVGIGWLLGRLRII